MATSIKIDDGMRSRVRRRADLRRRSARWIRLEGVKQHVEREEARESFKQEAPASWSELRETGRHLTGEEARAWPAAWGAADEGAAPDRHG